MSEETLSAQKEWGKLFQDNNVSKTAAKNILTAYEQFKVSEAEERLKIGDVLWIGVDKEGPLAHVWFKDNYLYNMYVDPRRPDNYAVRFVQFCIQFIDSKEIILYCDEWNIAAQKMFEKVGFEKYTPNK